MLPGCVPNYPLFLGLQTSLFCYWSESVGLHWSIEQRGVEDGIRWSYLEWQNRTVDHSIPIITVWMAALGNSVVRDRVECMWALQMVWYHLELKWGVGGGGCCFWNLVVHKTAMSLRKGFNRVYVSMTHFIIYCVCACMHVCVSVCVWFDEKCVCFAANPTHLCWPTLMVVACLATAGEYR